MLCFFSGWLSAKGATRKRKIWSAAKPLLRRWLRGVLTLTRERAGVVRFDTLKVDIMNGLRNAMWASDYDSLARSVQVRPQCRIQPNGTT